MGVTQEKILEKLGLILTIGYAFVLLCLGCLGPMWYAEIDSNTLPLISLQYRQSIVVNQSDIEQAQVDFPELQKDVGSPEDFRSAGLQETTDGNWLSYYFPIYPLLCIPVKLLFSFLSLDQQRCFFVTNALLVSGALLFLYIKLKVSPLRRILAVLMLAISPIVYFVCYLNYDAFIFAALTVAMVLYYNGNRNWSALFVSLGAMPNSTVAAIGLVMIIDYGIRVLWKNRRQHILLTIKQYFGETVRYAICFIPCLIPFAVQGYYLGRDTFSGAADTTNWLPRFLTYLFDPALGFTLFAPIGLCLFFVFAVLSVVKKNYRAFTWIGMFLAVVGAYSLMPHINCGMLFCARYVAWSYPLIPVFLTAFGAECFNKKTAFYLCMAGSVVSSFALMLVNPLIGDYQYNTTSKWLLKNVPFLYNEYSATFYCRTLHIDGAYDQTGPAYYKDDVTGQIYKLIYRADPGTGEQVLSDLKGDQASMDYLETQVEKNGEDGKFHYINFPSWGEYAVYEKTPVEQGLLYEGEVLVDESDVTMQDWGGGVNGYSIPMTITPNTSYQVELKISEEADVSNYPLIIDFYGEEYDNIQQEVSNFLIQGKTDYVFYLNSGNFNEHKKEVVARIFTTAQEEIAIDHFTVTKLVEPLSYQFTDGFYELEGTPEVNWSWCDETGILIVRNYTGEDQTVQLVANAYTGYEEISSLIIMSEDDESRYQISSAGTAVEYTFTAHPGENQISFSTDAQRVDAPDDPRSMYFRLQNASIEVVS